MIRFTRLFLGWVALSLVLSPAWAIEDMLAVPEWANANQANSVDVDTVNHSFGVKLFDQPLLWKEKDQEVATRLHWPEESRTSTQSSYRVYTTVKKSIKVLGCRAYSCALFAMNHQATEITLVFINEGDYNWIDSLEQPPPDDPFTLQPQAGPGGPSTSAAPVNDNPLSDLKIPTDPNKNQISLDSSVKKVSEAAQNAQANYQKALEHDTTTLKSTLSALFGAPQSKVYGDTPETQESVLRWDWKGHTMLLASPKERYVTLRILPTSVVDGQGQVDNLSSDDWKKVLLGRVKTEANGDVTIEDIPMVDQGPKGYCAPATWQRVMRYMGIPADLYVLAMAAQTSGSGTSLDNMLLGVKGTVKKYHHEIDLRKMNLETLKQSIDAGQPLIWTCQIYEPFDDSLFKRAEARAKVQDWEAWKKQVTQWSYDAPQLTLNNSVEGGHMRLITGYNFQTGELCISDSWGPVAKERWMTFTEAAKICEDQRVVFVITP